MLLFDIFDRGKKHGAAHHTKIFAIKLKFYRVSWIADHGRDATGNRAEILIVYGFKTILTIYGLYITDITVICGYINNI